MSNEITGGPGGGGAPGQLAAGSICGLRKAYRKGPWGFGLYSGK